MQSKFGTVAAIIVVAIGAFIAGMLVDRNLPTLLGSDTPKLISPARGEVVKSNEPMEFSWSAIPNADKYHIVVTHSATANYPAISQQMEVPRLEVHPEIFETDTGWTWKVKAHVGGHWSKWSEIGTFDLETRESAGRG